MVVPPSTGQPSAPQAQPDSRLSPASAGQQSLKSKQPAQTAPGTLNGPPSGNNHSIPLSARRAEPLDLSTVERRGGTKPLPSDEPKKKRLFGIPEAPTFRPTEEEFKDPMEYMRKIAPEGSKYGIVKIIPPDSWNPSFAINTERFHFRTRRQELNSVEGGNRVNNDYLDQLAKFHKQHGHNLNRFPSVDKRPLDLYRLKKTVEKKGGFDAVCKGKRWAEVGRDLGYSGKIMSSLSTSLKNSYQKWLLPYEEYLRMAKPGVHQQLEFMNGGPFTPSPGTSPAKKSQLSTPMGPASEQSSTVHATHALNASINGHADSPQPPPSVAQPEKVASQSTPPTAGFTPLNIGGGFTAVNAQPRPPPPPAAAPPSNGFVSVNTVNGAQSSAHSHGAPSQSSMPQPTPPVTNGSTSQRPPNTEAPSALKRQHSDVTLSPFEIEAMNRRSKRLRRDVPTVAGSNMHHSRMGMAGGVKIKNLQDRGDYKPGQVCEHCGKNDEWHKSLVCASCECAYHMYCLEPPLKQRPSHEWNCPRCLVGTGEYGFEEGDVYSLAGFQRKANEFKQVHFNNLPGAFSPFRNGKKTLDEEDVEREFWRLVEDLTDTVEVEYGADIHSTTHGSGFPTIERQPRDPYSVDPWNLNIWPLDKESLFRHIKQDVSGMTVPWLYVGMVFSTFCWHSEDHFTYSANYQHFGETKTWYGIPAADSYKFEEAMKEEVPELFETQPDLLFQLVTLAKPEKLRKAGVRVFAVDQHAGQFVVTFPRAYHAGFNHGFNFNEAVNFAPSDWEPFGEEGVKRLRDYRKQPCFSHDELLLTCAGRDNTIRTAKWLGPALQRMLDTELSTRRHFLTRGDSDSDDAGANLENSYMGPRYEADPIVINVEEEDLQEEVICSFCKAFCYLSKFVCKKTKRTLCLLHAGKSECCDLMDFERYSGKNGEHLLYYRMTDDQLSKTVAKVVEKGSIPETWAAKVDAELDENARPDLKKLRTLLAEGEKIQYDLPQLPDLRKFVDRCNEWVEEATHFITRKQQNRRKNEKVWRKSTNRQGDGDDRDKDLRNVDNIRRLLDKADMISFDCQEIVTLRERDDAIADFQREAEEALRNDHQRYEMKDYEELVERGKDFHVDIPEIVRLERLLMRLQWNEEARMRRPNPETMRQDNTLEDIEKFIERGLEIGFSESNQDIMFFREHKAQGELWEQKAKELMAVEQVHYQQLDALSRQAQTLPVSTETQARVDAILKKQREAQEKIQSLYDMSLRPNFRDRPTYKEVRDIMAALEELQSKPVGTVDLEKQQRKHEDWMRRGKKLFGKANAPLHILQQHMSIVENRNVHCFDLTDTPRMPVEPASRQASPAAEPVDGENAPHTETHGSSSSRDVFCICRAPEAGMMIECEICREWYHGKCLKIARGKVKEEDKYTCPICDYRVKIPRDAARPKLEELIAWQDDLETLPFQPEEEDTLCNIVNTAQAFRDYMRQFINPMMSSPEEVPTLRFYLRKIEGADILLGSETNYLRQELHKLFPVAPEAPPVIETSNSTRKPRPTKQQKLMAQLGITNPDDLPQQFKMKPHVSKRKASESSGRPQPLQPAGAGSPNAGGYPASATSSTGFGGIDGAAPATKSHLTPLAIQVLGDLAGAAVVSQMLQEEPHMMRDKLERIKTVLQQDRTIHNDLATVTSRVNELKNRRSYSPAFSYDNLHAATFPSVGSSFRDQPAFSTAPMANGSGANARQTARLGSPSQFTPPNFAAHESPNFDTTMFDRDTNGGPSFFDSPDRQTKEINSTSPSGTFGAKAGGIFDSPKPATVGITQAGMNSPGFGGSQPSTGIIDNIFADMVNDQEGSTDEMADGKPTATSYPMQVDDPAADIASEEIAVDPAIEAADEDDKANLAAEHESIIMKGEVDPANMAQASDGEDKVAA